MRPQAASCGDSGVACLDARMDIGIHGMASKDGRVYWLTGRLTDRNRGILADASSTTKIC
jgi:hypothetical protein